MNWDFCLYVSTESYGSIQQIIKKILEKRIEENGWTSIVFLFSFLYRNLVWKLMNCIVKSGKDRQTPSLDSLWFKSRQHALQVSLPHETWSVGQRFMYRRSTINWCVKMTKLLISVFANQWRRPSAHRRSKYYRLDIVLVIYLLNGPTQHHVRTKKLYHSRLGWRWCITKVVGGEVRNLILLASRFWLLTKINKIEIIKWSFL